MAEVRSAYFHLSELNWVVTIIIPVGVGVRSICSRAGLGHLRRRGGELPGSIWTPRPPIVLQAAELGTRLAQLRTQEAEFARRRRLLPNVI